MANLAAPHDLHLVSRSLHNASVADMVRPETDVAWITYSVPRRKWRLQCDYAHRDLIRMREILVPAGFEYDLASIPRQLWWAIGPHELSAEATLIHDYLYRYRGHPPIGAPYTRLEADQLFLAMMRDWGVSKHKRLAAYHAVRAFGAPHWAKGAKDALSVLP